MSDNPVNQPVSCTLSNAEVDDRASHIHTVLGEAYITAEERTNGYFITFQETGEILSALSTFVINERQCCAFAEYTISSTPPYETISLTITGPDGTKAQFADLIDRLESDTPSVDGAGITEITHRSHQAIVREAYASVAQAASETTEKSPSSCCGPADRGDGSLTSQSQQMGYTAEDIGRVEPGANLGLGCGNPVGLAQLSTGDSVVDLGSGAGFDCFLAAQEVGPEGQVIGVDMTPEMIDKARENATQQGTSNVEFRLGEIEHLPVADESVDVIISNCVINLSPNKPRVFDEAYRVLNPGGRLAISDIVMTAELPADIMANPSSLTGCISGSSTIDALESMLLDAGFETISIEPKDESKALIRDWDSDRDLSEYIVAATIEGQKPPSKRFH